MQRCENEIVNRINACNVTDLLIKMFPHTKRLCKHAKIVDDDQELVYMQSTVQQKFEEQVGNILSVAQKFFLTEFADVLIESSGSEIEKKLASVPGLIISIFTHIAE